jgi:hypothetical protein
MRHIIAGRFSSSDIPTLPNTADVLPTLFDLIQSEQKIGYGVGNALDDLNRMCLFPSEIGLDLLILAIHVYAADTRISRKTESQDTWTREIHLVVPVSDPDHWAAEIPLLQRMLNFLTGDRWSFTFRPRPSEFSGLVPKHPRPKKVSIGGDIALISGGLDSLLGAIDTVESGVYPCFISHAGDGATSHAQEVCFEGLREYYKGVQLNRLRVWTSFPQRFIRGIEPESTTRGRSFLFFAIGVLAGTGYDGGFVLRAPENGLIAINVPLDPLRLGALSTRTMHPFYLARWNDLLGGLDIRGRIENPYWDRTKGEMVMNCMNSELLRQLIPLSLSCSSPSKARWQRHGIEHCGHCLPCIIRRAALEKAFGIGEDPTTYTLSDLRDRTLDTTQVEGQQVRSLQYIIERLHARPDLAKLLIHKPGPLSDLSPEKQESLADVYRRGMEEVDILLTNVRT